MSHIVESLWYKNRCAAWIVGALFPLATLFSVVAYLRKQYLLRRQRPAFTVPIIVVGNITVGGAGKTPLVIALVEHLQAQGLKPAVVSRGYGGAAQYPYRLAADSTAAQSGDEPLLIFKRCGCPVVVAPQRVDAVAAVLAHTDANVIISDDGLQHYALPRSMEIAVIDGARGLGNGWRLPLGPLREPVARLKTVDFVVTNGEAIAPLAAVLQRERVCAWLMQLQLGELRAVREHMFTDAPVAGDKIHAVAAIGHPQRFFNSLESLGFAVDAHPFADHHAFDADELLFSSNYPVVMTEKDAVKCAMFDNLRNHWFLPVAAHLSPAFWQAFDAKLAVIAPSLMVNVNK